MHEEGKATMEKAWAITENAILMFLAKRITERGLDRGMRMACTLGSIRRGIHGNEAEMDWGDLRGKEHYLRAWIARCTDLKRNTVREIFLAGQEEMVSLVWKAPVEMIEARRHRWEEQTTETVRTGVAT
jgi:hypothetical protein